jgi:hypothetical protein
LDWDPSGPLGKINPLLPDENPATEKSHLAIWLTPRSPRMQYGLDLSRRLAQRMASVCETHGSRLSVFYPEPPDQSLSDAPDIVVQKVGNRFYKTSRSQLRANHDYLNEGLDVVAIPISVGDWRVSESDGHLNDAANEQVMRGLAEELLKRASRQSVSAESSKGIKP